MNESLSKPVAIKVLKQAYLDAAASERHLREDVVKWLLEGGPEYMGVLFDEIHAPSLRASFLEVMRIEDKKEAKRLAVQIFKGIETALKK